MTLMSNKWSIRDIDGLTMLGMTWSFVVAIQIGVMWREYLVFTSKDIHDTSSGIKNK